MSNICQYHCVSKNKSDWTVPLTFWKTSSGFVQSVESVQAICHDSQGSRAPPDISSLNPLLSFNTHCSRRQPHGGSRWFCMFPHRPGEGLSHSQFECWRKVSWSSRNCRQGRLVRGSCGPFPTHFPMSPGGCHETVSYLIPEFRWGTRPRPPIRVQLPTVQLLTSSLKLAPQRQGVPSFVMRSTGPFCLGVTCTRATFAYSTFVHVGNKLTEVKRTQILSGLTWLCTWHQYSELKYSLPFYPHMIHNLTLNLMCTSKSKHSMR